MFRSILLFLFLSACGLAYGAQLQSIELSGAGAYDGVVTITRDSEGRLVLRDATRPAGVRLEDLLEKHAAHSGLSALDADDHPHYLNPARHAAAHSESFNNALAIAPDPAGNTTLGAHVGDVNLHLRRDGAETISGTWNFAAPLQLPAGLQSAGTLELTPNATGAALTSLSTTVVSSGMTAWHAPSEAESLARTPEGTPWDEAYFVLTADEDAAQAVTTERTEFLMATGFDFGVPSDATITGVEVRAVLTRLVTYGAFVDDWIGLVDETTLAGANRARPSEVLSSTSFVTREWGGASDLFGLALTPAVVNASGFGVALAFKPAPGITTCDPMIDYIEMRVHYTQTQTAHWAVGTQPGTARYSIRSGAQDALSIDPATRRVGLDTGLALNSAATTPTVVNGALQAIAGRLYWGRADHWVRLD